jgi:hypothetical protein
MKEACEAQARSQPLTREADDLTGMTVQTIPSLARVRTIGGYGAAIAATPYLLIKIAWTFGLFLPTEEMGATSWRVINAATAVLAVIAILLALAFSRPWGERLPAPLIALPIWLGTGLLVPMVLLVPVLGPAAVGRDAQAGAADIWVHEQIFIMLSLVGVGVGLPIALAGYVHARWPQAVRGTVDFVYQPGHTRGLQAIIAKFVAIGCILLGTIKVFWAAGGALGLDSAMLDERNLWWHMLSLSTGAWAFAGAWGVLLLTSGRGSRRILPPMAAAWISSGMMFSHSLYNLLLNVDESITRLEYPLAHLLTNQGGIVLGVLMGMVILLVLHDRRRALHSDPN